MLLNDMDSSDYDTKSKSEYHYSTRSNTNVFGQIWKDLLGLHIIYLDKHWYSYTHLMYLFRYLFEI